MNFKVNEHPHDRNWIRIRRDFWITVGFNVIANIMGIIAISYHTVGNKFTPMLWAFACLISGGLIGFLFGIPRVLQDNNVQGIIQKNNEEKDNSLKNSQPYYRMQVNTNLEQISDWLTKIIVGVGLIELQRNIFTPFIISCTADLVGKYQEEALQEGAILVTSSPLELIKQLQNDY